MSNTRKLLRGSVLSMAGMGTSMIGALGSAMIFWKIMAPSAVGIFATLRIAADAFVLLSGLGVRNALPKLLAGEPDDYRRLTLLHASLTWQWVISAGSAVAVVVFWLLVPDPALISTKQVWLDAYPWLWILPALFATASQVEILMAALAGIGQYGVRASGMIAASLVNVALVAVLIGWLKGGLPHLLAATILAVAAQVAWLYTRVPGGMKMRWAGNEYQKAVRFSLPLYINNIFGFLFQRCDTLLVAWLLGPAMAACFEYGAKRLPNYFSSFMAAALVPFLPGVAGALGEGRRAEAAQMLERTYRMTSLISYGAVFLALLFQAPVIRFLLTEKGMAGLPALSLIMVSSGMALQAGIMGLTLVALDRPYIVTWTNILAAIVSVVANIILIPRFGLVGAGWSAIAATGLSNILQTAGVWHAGLGFSVGTWLKPHLLLGISILILFFGGNTTEMRIVALLVFIAGAFVLRLVSVAELDAATRAFLGRERRRA